MVSHLSANDLRFKMVYLMFRILKTCVFFSGKVIVGISLGEEYIFGLFPSHIFFPAKGSLVKEVTKKLAMLVLDCVEP